MTRIKGQVSQFMAAIRAEGVPTSEQMVNEAFRRCGLTPDKVKADFVRGNFNSLLNKVWLETLKVLEEYEEKAYTSGIPEHLARLRPGDFSEAERRYRGSATEAFRFLFHRLYAYLRECFLSIAQSRKARGGKDFELQISKLFDLMKVPYEMTESRYRVDFLMPNREHFERDKTRSILASVKRTLRERWREVVEELYSTRCPNVYLLTADKSVSAGQQEAIIKYNIRLVVWDEVKEKRFKETPHVLSYSDWARDELGHFIQIWSRQA